MRNIFISYACADDEPFVEHPHNDLTDHGFGIWWDRQTMQGRGLTFLQELRDVIEGSDRMIAVIGPNTVKSDYVRAEWEHALLFSKDTIPILREGDYSLIPDELVDFHCPDFRGDRPYHEPLEEMLRILAEPVSPHEYSWRYT
ncbi:MAG: toll/interleukin-1 receptor domain-containing protein [Euryarchaeota archaeon]|nr:toll/interleukin-1 receptor domain-containing protein [Euryarchaeota archaeon]